MHRRALAIARFCRWSDHRAVDWFIDGPVRGDPRRANQTSSAGQRRTHSSGNSGKSLFVVSGGTWTSISSSTIRPHLAMSRIHSPCGSANSRYPLPDLPRRTTRCSPNRSRTSRSAPVPAPACTCAPAWTGP